MLSNDELGRRIGVSHSMASRIRNGRRLPSTRTLARICQEFDIPLPEAHQAYECGPLEFGLLVSRAVDSHSKIAA